MCSKVSKKRLTLTNMKPGASAAGTALGLEALLQGQPDAAAPAGKGAAGATRQPLPRRGSLCQKRPPMLQDRTCREKVAFARRELPVLHGNPCREEAAFARSGCLCYKTAPAGKRLLFPEGSAAAAALQSGDGAGSKPGLRP